MLVPIPGSVVAITGYLGAGKTMAATYFLFQEFLRGRKVIANIPTIFAPRARFLEHFTESLRTSILWDELQESLDSREYRNNVLATRRAIFLRKRGNVLFYTVPDISMVDRRIRLLTNYICSCSVLRDGVSIVTMYSSKPNGSVNRLGALLLEHSIYGGLYDSFDEDVLLLPYALPEVAKPPRRATRARGPEPVGQGPRPVAALASSFLSSLTAKGGSGA